MESPIHLIFKCVLYHYVTAGFINGIIEYITVIEEAAMAHPNLWWWLKEDGCDLNKGLKESARGQWSGDVDLNDGSLQLKNNMKGYRTRLEVAANVGLKGGCLKGPWCGEK